MRYFSFIPDILTVCILELITSSLFRHIRQLFILKMELFMLKTLIKSVSIALFLMLSIQLSGADPMNESQDKNTSAETAISSSPGVIHATLNGLAIAIDAQTGGIVGLSYDGPGQILESPANEAAAIDMAYPIKTFEPLRLASRFSKDAKVTVSDTEVTIHYTHLGASRDVFEQPGDVAVTIRIKAADDGRSIIMSATVENHSETAIHQIIFPDLAGLLPVAGVSGTIFKTAGFGNVPFAELAPSEGRLSYQWMQDSAFSAVEYKSGGMFSPMWLRWMDLGGLNGGMSLFSKRWGWDPRVAVRLRHHSTESKLHLMCVHSDTIATGQTWSSGEFVLTPHKGGWAKGIETYREWVDQNLVRKYPVPQHVREGLGFRTLWMSQSYANDPQDAIWKVADLLPTAQTAKAHGLTEMSLWGWHKHFELPLPEVFPHLGTQEQFIEALAQCKKLGVNIAPWISIVQADYHECEKYGITPPESGGWAQHTETVPRFQAPYTTRYRSVGVPMTNELWQREALAACLKMVDENMFSIGWDQVWSTEGGQFQRIAHQVVDAIKAADPTATFSGEELWNIEDDATFLDYTWNWGGYRDCQAFTNSFPAPRVNSCIHNSPMEVKRAFVDGLYMNIMPTKPDSVNGSARITDYPELSAALKQCAALRSQFLPCFVDGRLIGRCILKDAMSPAVHTSAWVLPDRILVLMLNKGGDAVYSFTFDMGLWMEPGDKGYAIQAYNSNGEKTQAFTADDGLWAGNTGSLPNLDIALFEITRD